MATSRAENDAADAALIEWLSRSPQEETLEPDLPIIDPHHHAWLDGAVHHRYLIDEMAADFGSGHNVVSTVFVDCESMYTEGVSDGMEPVGETMFAQGLAAMADSGKWGATRIAQGIISRVDLTLGPETVEKVLRAHMRAPNFRGVRTFKMAHWPPQPGVPDIDPLDDPAFAGSVAVLEKLGLILEVYCGENLAAFTRIVRLAEMFPQLTIVFNHCGAKIGPACFTSTEVVDEWTAQVAAVAACENVIMKLGKTDLMMAVVQR